MDLENYIRTTCSLGTFFIALFTTTNYVVSDTDKDKLFSWLINNDRNTVNNWSLFFINSFDSLFDKSHYSFKRIKRSFLSTFGIGLIISIIYSSTMPYIWGKIPLYNLILQIIRLFLIVPIFNSIIDLFAIAESRYIIGIMHTVSNNATKVCLLILDVILNIIIHLLFIILLVFILTIIDIYFSYNILSQINLFYLLDTDYYKVWTNYLINEYKKALIFSSTENVSFTISIYTTFMTSIWVWLFYLSTFLFKLIINLKIRLFGFLKKEWVKKNPILTLGILSVLIISTICFIIYVIFT